MELEGKESRVRMVIRFKLYRRTITEMKGNRIQRSDDSWNPEQNRREEKDWYLSSVRGM